ncbi:hypothetical protein LTR37_004086 [Vermiconidia calcicola]|uniref:Uncharacterized protein n=1 Tax=Vermiconidia calcicola TaxID=1690605 RepID=A0ACC3NPU0_9PEZI|nr:hypothetical protein LTR37_004086 [Vermiconidia calcicola]
MQPEYTSSDFWAYTCGEAKAARWMLVPLLLSMSSLAIMAFLALKRDPSSHELDTELEGKDKVDLHE